MEMFLSGEWGTVTVCHDENYSNRMVVCHQLGYYSDSKFSSLK